MLDRAERLVKATLCSFISLAEPLYNRRCRRGIALDVDSGHVYASLSEENARLIPPGFTLEARRRAVAELVRAPTGYSY